MNRKKIQRLSTLLAFLAVIPLIIMSIFACVQNAQNSTEEPPAVIEDNKDNDKAKTQQPIIDGIYYFESDVSFLDIHYFIAQEKVFKYFGCNDINGLKRFAVEHGFNEFAKNITKSNEKTKYIEFVNNSKVSSYYYEHGNFTLINSPEFEYKYTDSLFVSEGINPRIENDRENKRITLYYPFYYELDDGTQEITPLFVKVRLSYFTDSYDSVAVNDATVYKFQEKSCKLVYDFSKNIDKDDVLDKVAKLFKLVKTENVISDVEDLLSKNKLAFNSNFTTVTLFNDENGLSFSYHDINNLSFEAYDGVKISVTNKSLGIAQVNELVLTIQIDENISLTYTIEHI